MKTLRKIESDIDEARQEIRLKMLALYSAGRITDEERLEFLKWLNEIQINLSQLSVLRTGSVDE